MRGRPRIYLRMSYTLYLVHVPLLALLSGAIVGSWEPVAFGRIASGGRRGDMAICSGRSRIGFHLAVREKYRCNQAVSATGCFPAPLVRPRPQAPDPEARSVGCGHSNPINTRRRRSSTTATVTANTYMSSRKF